MRVVFPEGGATAVICIVVAPFIATVGPADWENEYETILSWVVLLEPDTYA